mmetsp:Transcript_19541/g.40481  ORF Transcript_19541/g.40481 Transcript_19541/m.40481 type:complete len:201 (+) Transcript_19541:1162-1764(+)
MHGGFSGTSSTWSDFRAPCSLAIMAFASSKAFLYKMTSPSRSNENAVPGMGGSELASCSAPGSAPSSSSPSVADPSSSRMDRFGDRNGAACPVLRILPISARHWANSSLSCSISIARAANWSSAACNRALVVNNSILFLGVAVAARLLENCGVRPPSSSFFSLPSSSGSAVSSLLSIMSSLPMDLSQEQADLAARLISKA